ncbi:MAG TPA: heavy metal-responsive transcriptional regulator [Pyrinomonadaceae bacterium]|jgi:DNA-binding transcriptional MerR regulator|nr:heavy metal-responsive transcriptional regulator [Pyrinomonadaceae bacterium]
MQNNNDSKTGYVRIGELANAAGVSPDTLRHYERKGVLQRARRSGNGYREYPKQAVLRVRMIRQALSLGFTLDELSEVFKVADRGGIPCQRVRNLAAEKLSNIEVDLKEMMKLRNDLRQTLNDWDTRLAHTAPGHQAGLLKALARPNHGRNPSTTFRLRKPAVRKKGRKRND